jgi:hypothetical protein
MKATMTFFLCLTLLNSSYLLEIDSNSCVYNIYPQEDYGWCYTYHIDNTEVCSDDIRFSSFIPNFSFSDGSCIPIDKSNIDTDYDGTGLTENQFNFLQGLMGNLMGFFLTFLLGFLFILLGRR